MIWAPKLGKCWILNKSGCQPASDRWWRTGHSIIVNVSDGSGLGVLGYATWNETMNHAYTSHRMQFLADYPAKRGFNLLARHSLVERLVDEGLVAAFPGLGLEECNDGAIQHN